jgi:hypothetical protein
MGRIDRSTKASTGGVVGGTGGDDVDAPESPIGVSERLTIELARLRAKFGTDPASADASFDEAWMSPTAAMEEDEAEFIDAVADCLGVGLSLDAALSCWDAGGLSYDDAAAQDGHEDGQDDEDDEQTTEVSLPAVAAHHPHVTGRRLIIP